MKRKLSSMTIVAMGMAVCLPMVLMGASKAPSGGSSSTLSADIQTLVSGYVKPVNQKPKKHLRIAVLGVENNPFWYDVKAGADVANIVLSKDNAQVDWIVPSGGQSSQGTSVMGPGIQDAIVQHYDAIATLGPDSGIVPYVQQATKQNIPMATFNTDSAALKSSERMVFVGQDLYAAGEEAAKLMAKAIGGQGEVGIITGYFNIEAHQERLNGFKNYMAKHYPKIKIVGVVQNQVQAQQSYSETVNFMTAHPDLKGIYVTVADTGAGQAVIDHHYHVKVVDFDYSAQQLKLLTAGGINTLIGQDPFAQGYEVAVDLYNYLVNGTKPAHVMQYTGYQVITKANVAKFEHIDHLYASFYNRNSLN